MSYNWDNGFYGGYDGAKVMGAGQHIIPATDGSGRYESVSPLYFNIIEAAIGTTQGVLNNIVNASGYINTQNHVEIGASGNTKGLILYDEVDGTGYTVTISGGGLTVTTV